MTVSQQMRSPHHVGASKAYENGTDDEGNQIDVIKRHPGIKLPVREPPSHQQYQPSHLISHDWMSPPAQH